MLGSDSGSLLLTLAGSLYLEFALLNVSAAIVPYFHYLEPS